jgi:TonB family protein
MTRSLAAAISFLLASIALWPQLDTAKPKSETSPSAPSSSSPASSAPSSSSGVLDSTKIEVVKGERAIYPLAAAEKKLQGQVWVRLHISETGDVEVVDVLSGDPILAAAAVSAIKKWKFKPYIKNGHPVKVLYKMPMDFALRENVKDTPMPGENSSVASGDKNPADASSQPPNANNLAGTKQVRISQGVSTGLLLHKVQPIYPYEAMRNHVQGTVLLRAVIDKNGRISSLQPISGPKELTAAAIGAVEQWRYRPYLLEGEPVEVETQITVNFQLR